MALRTFAATIHYEDGLYVAMCPEVGTIGQGLTRDEAVLNLKRATELYLAEFPPTDIGQISLTTFEAEYPD